MILKKISIKNFGKLKDINIELNNGLNIIYGKNEAGKSTLLGFIKGVFYGLQDKSKNQNLSEVDKFRPWSGQEFTGMIEYDLDGATYKAARNFNTDKVSLCNEFWDDITDKFPKDKKKGSLFAVEHLGLSEESFEKTILVKQMESRVSNYNKELIDKLINVQQTGSEEVSYLDAIQILDTTQKEKIGSNKTKKKPLNLIEQKIIELEKSKNEINIIRNEVLNLEERIMQKNEEKNKISSEIELRKQNKNLYKKQELLDKYNKAKEYETDLEEIENQLARLDEYKSFPIELEEQFKDLLIQAKNNENLIQNKKKSLSDIETKIANAKSNNEILDSKEVIDQIRIDLGMLKKLLAEKNEITKKIEDFELQFSQFVEDNKQSIDTNSDNYDASFNDYQNQLLEYQSKIIKIEDIKKRIDLLNNGAKEISCNIITDEKEHVISMGNIKDIVEKHKNLNKYSTQIEEIETAINTIKEEVNKIKDTVDGYDFFGESYDFNRGEVEKHFNQSKNNLHNDLHTKKISKKNMLCVFAFSVALILLMYSFYNILTSFDLRAYAGISLAIIFGIIGVANLSESKVDNSVQTVADGTDIQEILHEIKVSSFSQFEQYINKYNNANQIIDNLEESLRDYITKLELLKQKQTTETDEICNMLGIFDIKYDSKKISNNEIDILKKTFIDKISQSNNAEIIINFNTIEKDINELLAKVEQLSGYQSIEYSDIQVVLDELEDKKQKVKYIVNELSINSNEVEKFNQFINIQNNLLSKQKEIEYLKYTLSNLENKIDDSYKTIVDAFKKCNIEIDYNNNINFESVNFIEEKLNNAEICNGECSNYSVIGENIVLEISEAEKTKDILQTKIYEILSKAGVETEKQFSEASESYYKYFQLFEEKNRIEKVYYDLFKGQTSEEILQGISGLQGLNSSVELNASFEQLDNEIEQLNNELIQVDREIMQYKSEISNKLDGKMSINEVVETIENLKNQKKDLEMKSNAINVAIEVIREATQKIQKDFSPRFQNEMSSVISEITDGKYTEVRPNEELHLNVINPKTKQVISVDSLSQGTIDQLYLGLRIALSNLINNNKTKLPLIIDEAFSQYDDFRVKNALEFLIKESKERQIIIFTCQKREIEIIKELKTTDNVKIIEMK